MKHLTILLALAGCAVPDVQVATTSPTHITVCRHPDRPATAQQAENTAVSYCAARGLVQRAVNRGMCPTHDAMISVRYECEALPRR